MLENEEKLIEEEILDEDRGDLEEPELDEEGNPVQKEEPELDEEGNPVQKEEPELDEEGNPVQKEEPTYYTQEQVESAVKSRVNTFNRKLEKMKPYETAVNKLSEITGMDVNTLVSRLEAMTEAQQAQILGLTPEQYANKKQEYQQKQQTVKQTTALTRELEIEKLKSNPTYKDVNLYKDEINELLEDNPKLSVKQAYLLAKGETATTAAVRDAEQRAVAKMTKTSNQKVLKPGPTKVTTGPKIDPSIIAAAKKVGMDPAEYAAFSGISDMDGYEKFKQSKQK